MGALAVDEVPEKAQLKESNVGVLSKLLKSLELSEVPERYIQAPDAPLTPHDKYADLPVVDLSLLKSDPDRVATEAREAVAKYGFVQVVNHNVPMELIRREEALAREFFNLPADVKQKTHFTIIKGYNGGFRADSTLKVLPWREAMLIGYDPLPPQQKSTLNTVVDILWPEGNQPFIDTCTEYVEEVAQLCLQILELLALSLGLSKDHFSQHFPNKRTVGTVGWNHYPSNPRADRVLGSNAHVDPNCLTLLWQDAVGGLQIKHEDEWLGIRPIEGAFVINVGDLLQAWSNDRFKSVMHRVAVNCDQDRLSMALFASPHYTTVISAPDELVDEENPRKYKAFTPMEYGASLRNCSNNSKFNLTRTRLEAWTV